MTILLGEYGPAQHSSIKKIDCTQPFREDNVDLGGAPANFTSSLPTVQTPGTGVSFVFGANDRPTFSDKRATCKYSAVIYVSGKNTTGASITLNSQAKRNGANQGVSTNITVSANCFWTLTIFRYFDVSVGDVISADIWASAAGLTVDYTGFSVYPTRVNIPEMGVSPNYGIFRDLNYYMAVTLPALYPATGGTTNISNTQAYLVHPNNAFNIGTGAILPAANNGSINITGSRNAFPVASLPTDFGFGRMQNGDQTLNITTGSGNSTTNRNWTRQAYPYLITYRELLR